MYRREYVPQVPYIEVVQLMYIVKLKENMRRTHGQEGIILLYRRNLLQQIQQKRGSHL